MDRILKLFLFALLALMTGARAYCDVKDIEFLCLNTDFEGSIVVVKDGEICFRHNVDDAPFTSSVFLPPVCREGQWNTCWSESENKETLLWVCYKSKNGYAILCCSDSDVDLEPFKNTLSLFLQENPQPIQYNTPSAEVLKKYVGRYRFAVGAFVEFSIENQQLIATTKTQPYRSVMVAQSDIEFVDISGTYRAVFQFDGSGNVVGVTVTYLGLSFFGKKIS